MPLQMQISVDGDAEEINKHPKLEKMEDEFHNAQRKNEQEPQMKQELSKTQQKRLKRQLHEATLKLRNEEQKPIEIPTVQVEKNVNMDLEWSATCKRERENYRRKCVIILGWCRGLCQRQNHKRLHHSFDGT